MREKKSQASVGEQDEQWRTFLAGMEAALGLSKKEAQKIRSQARRRAHTKAKQYWMG